MDWHCIPSLAALRAFEAAARHQSLSAAARELNVTHAAIAQHVRALEQEFSDSLLVRQGRGVAATAAGRALAERLGDGFQTIAEAVGDLRDRNADRPINITVTPGFAGSWLMPRIGAFWAKHPEIQVNINPSCSVLDLRQEGFDMGVRYGAGDWPKLEAEMLTAAAYCAVAHPDLVTGREVRSLHDLTDLPWVMDSYEREQHRVLEGEGIDLAALDVTLLSTNDLALSAALAGLGVTVQPSSIVERDVRSGQLVKLFELKDNGLGYHMVTVPGRSTPHLRTFMAWLRKVARQEQDREMKKAPGAAGASCKS